MKLLYRLIVCSILLSFSKTALQAQGLPRALLLTGNGNDRVPRDYYPPWRHEFQNTTVIDILKNIVEIDTATDMAVLNTSHLKQYDLVISNSIFLEPSEAQLEALNEFVRNGKSYLTLHCGILSLLNWDKYEEFMGGIFIGGPSSDPQSYKVYTENNEFWGYGFPFRQPQEHPVSLVTDDFITTDELYYFQPNTKDLQVIARAENHPVMWWHPFGNGRVMSLTLGHDEKAKQNPGYQQLLVNGVRWLTGIPLVQASHPRILSTRSENYTGLIKLNSFIAGDDARNITYQISKNSSPQLFAASVNSTGSIDVQLNAATGHGRVSVLAINKVGRSTQKNIDLHIVKDGEGNIAEYQGNSATASSNENKSPMFDAQNLIDGDTLTRWSSARADSFTVIIDLQKEYLLQRIGLLWEASYAKEYEVSISASQDSWQKLVSEKNGNGGSDILQLSPTRGRYIKIVGSKRAPGKWGYSLYEVRLFGRDG